MSDRYLNIVLCAYPEGMRTATAPTCEYAKGALGFCNPGAPVRCLCRKHPAQTPFLLWHQHFESSACELSLKIGDIKLRCKAVEQAAALLRKVLLGYNFGSFYKTH